MSEKIIRSQLNEQLSKYVKFSGSSFLADKHTKNLSYALALLAIGLKRKTPTSDAAVGLSKLACQLSMARYVFRLNGFFESVEAFLNKSWAFSDDSKQVQLLTQLQALTMIFYYPLEHIALSGYVAPKLLNIDADLYSRRSCYWWTTYILIDVYAISLRLQGLSKGEKALVLDDSIPVEKRQQMLQDIRKRREELYWNLLRNAFYFPNAVHWSMKKGFLPDPLVQFFGLAEGLIGFWRSWKNL